MFGDAEDAVRPRKVDRRVERTRTLLREALLSLIREKGFEALSVQEIIDRANVGRATFYTHFDNKEDLLLTGLEGLRVSLKDLQRQAHARGGSGEDRLFAFSRELFAHTSAHRDVFQAMVGEKSVALVQQAFRLMLTDLIRADVKAVLQRDRTAAVPVEPTVQFVAAGLFGLLMWWLETRTRPGVEEITTVFQRLALSVLRAAFRPSV